MRTEQYWLVRMRNHQEYLGRLIEKTDLYIRIDTAAGTVVRLSVDSIRHMRAVGTSVVRRWKRSLLTMPITHHYFLNASAYGPPVGEGYYQTQYLLLHQVAFGLTEYFSIRAGGTFGFQGAAAKISFPLTDYPLVFGWEGLFGLNSFSSPVNGQSRSLALSQGLVTVGTRVDHLTLGIGLYTSSGRWARAPFFSVSGTARLSPKFSLMSESILWTANDRQIFLSTLGGRIYDKTLVLDLALWYSDESLAPWVGMAVLLY